MYFKAYLTSLGLLVSCCSFSSSEAFLLDPFCPFGCREFLKSSFDMLNEASTDNATNRYNKIKISTQRPLIKQQQKNTSDTNFLVVTVLLYIGNSNEVH